MSDSQDWEAQLAKLKADVDRFGSDLQFHGLSIAAHQVRLGLFDKGLVEVQEQQDYVNSVMNEQKANAIYLEGLLDGYSRMLRAKTRPKKKKPEKKGKIKRCSN